MSNLIKKKVITDNLYGTLGHFFKHISNMNDHQDRDITFLSALTIISACLPNYHGLYRHKEYSPHLYLFVSGESGTSKAKATDLIPFIMPIHDRYLEESKIEFNAYEERLRLLPKESKRPEKPKKRKLLLSAKTTEAAFYKDMDSLSDVGGLLVASEADLLSGSMRGEHGGGLSEALRQSFEHEFINKSLSTDDLYFFIKRPKLAVLLAGTPGQLKKMMGEHVENGLLNRFMFYNTVIKGDNFKSNGGDNTNKIIDALRFNVDRMHSDLLSRDEPLVFNWQGKIQEDFDVFFSAYYKRYSKIAPYYRTVIKRLGVMGFRTMMILAAIREKDNLNHAKNIICNDMDFFHMTEIFKTVISHCISVHEQFVSPQKVFKVTPLTVFEQMPDKFLFIDFSNQVQGAGKNPMTAQRWLKKLQEDGLLEKLEDERGYQKI